ncbi:MAG: DNA ligase (NAD(+)) LigA [Chloroflexi bacterium]|nr:DNA ligase (NAD(+)) LigA [Chloroflexota bacterium]|tara:strand:+ start:6093 stop:8117 length:2025 start_codon:yes stop_codon:yes gene_type:complete
MEDEENFKLANSLKEQIQLHNYRYYVLDDPIIPDSEYDKLFRALLELENKLPELKTSESPTQRVGGSPAPEFREVIHSTPMLSLGNVFNEKELLAWHNRAATRLQQDDFEMVCEPKVDGLAISLTYQNGILVQGATRGDGTRGEDVTANVRTVRSIPLSLNSTKPPEKLEVRGEIYFPRDEFENFNQERLKNGQTPFANPRNAAAGSLRQLDSQITSERHLSIWVYQLGLVLGVTTPSNHWETMLWLKSLGFRVNPAMDLFTDLNSVTKYHQKWVGTRDQENYLTDGVVVKVNSFAYQQELGFISREPRWAVAYKFPSDQAVTTLLDIGINVGRTGNLNPYAILEPVQLGGVVIQHATLHNEEDIRRKDIRIGDHVIIERAGEVIPQVIGPVTANRTGIEVTFKMPTECPICSSVVYKVEGEAAHKCSNINCPSQQFERIKHFVSKSAMDIDGLGEKLVRQLLDLKIISEFADIYYLGHDDLLKIERMGEKSASNLLSAIEASKNRPLASLISGLGISHVGSETAELIANRYKSLDKISIVSLEDFETIPGIGTTVGVALVNYFNNPENIRVINKLRTAGLRLTDNEITSQVVESQSFSGLRFVLTGRVDGYTRSDLENFVKNRGGSTSSSVTSKTDYLVVGEDPGSKLADAERLGVHVISFEELQNLDKRGPF